MKCDVNLKVQKEKRAGSSVDKTLLKSGVRGMQVWQSPVIPALRKPR